MEWIVALCISSIYYAFHGYGLLLRAAASIARSRSDPVPECHEDQLPSITVLLTVANEVDKIEARLSNFLSCRYPLGKLEILVASDGSTDGTDEAVLRFSENRPVRLFRSEQKSGKTATQNKAVPVASGDIIVFTDADTRFSPDTLLEFSKAFADSRVGGTTGRIIFETQPGAISTSQGYYWTYEMALRSLESALGCLAVASGQCMAIRKSLFRQMPEFVGEDCIVPLDIVLQGYRYVHVDRAVAYDVMEHEPEREMRTRIRMTMRNWTGTWLRSQLLNPFRFPCVSFALWSHKLIRWLSPFFMLGATVCIFALPPRGGYLIVWIGMLSFYAACAVGWLASLRGRTIPLASTLFSFALANIGFFVGVIKALRGDRIHSYRAGHL